MKKPNIEQVKEIQEIKEKYSLYDSKNYLLSIFPNVRIHLIKYYNERQMITNNLELNVFVISFNILRFLGIKKTEIYKYLAASSLKDRTTVYNSIRRNYYYFNYNLITDEFISSIKIKHNIEFTKEKLINNIKNYLEIFYYKSKLKQQINVSYKLLTKENLNIGSEITYNNTTWYIIGIYININNQNHIFEIINEKQNKSIFKSQIEVKNG
jgi:hypothetical protein